MRALQLLRLASITSCTGRRALLDTALHSSEKMTEAADSLPESRNSCVPCSSLDRSFLLSDDHVRNVIAATLPLWSLQPNGSSNGMCLARAFTAKNFQSALDCINEMGAIAERESHHPNFHLTNYRDVAVEIWTHKLGGITENDITLAKLLDAEVKIDYSPKWLKENHMAKSTAKSA